MSSEQDTYTPSIKVGSELYDMYFSNCFTNLLKPNEPQDAGWIMSLQNCIQRQVEAFTLTASFHQNHPTFIMPIHAAAEEEEEEEEE